MNQTLNGDATTLSVRGETTTLPSQSGLTATPDTPLARRSPEVPLPGASASSIPIPEERSPVTANIAADLEEIVQPLIDLLNGVESESDDANCYIAGTEDPERLLCRRPAVFIELPQGLCSEPWLLPRLRQVVMALLTRTGLEAYCQPEDEIDDFARGPLWFRLIKQTHFEPEAEYFHSYMQLLVEANNLDVVAARRQIARLVKYLQDDAEVGSYDAEEFVRL